MPSHIVKPNRDEDFYVEWSSIVDGPTAAGSRADIVRLAAERGWSAEVEERLQRADDSGCSALWYRPSWDDDEVYIYDQQGWVRRSQLRALVESLDDRGQPTDATLALLAPLD